MKAICNIDTLEAGIEIGGWHIGHAFVLELEDMKKKLEEHDLLFMPIKLNGIMFNLQNHGIKGYPYVLVNEECFNLYVAKKPMNGHCPIRVSLRSRFLWEHGYWKAWDIVKETVKYLGLKYEGSKLSRVDLACHIQGMDLTTIFNTTQDFNKIRTRAKQRCRPAYDFECYPHVEMTSIVVGSGDNIMLRIYDKEKEMQDKRAVVKEEFFKKVIWPKAGIKTGEGHIYNIEFQMRREAFKTFHFINGQELSSAENLFFCINDLWAYLTNEWFSLVNPRSDSNRTRQAMLPDWDYVSKQKFDLEENGFTELQRMYHKGVRQDIALRGVAAYATSFAVLCENNDFTEVMKDIYSRLDYLIDQGAYNWNKKIREKLNRLHSIKDIPCFEGLA